MKSNVHNLVGNITEAFASLVKELAANTSELFTPLACTLSGPCRSSVNEEFVALAVLSLKANVRS